MRQLFDSKQLDYGSSYIVLGGEEGLKQRRDSGGGGEVLVNTRGQGGKGFTLCDGYRTVFSTI